MHIPRSQRTRLRWVQYESGETPEEIEEKVSGFSALTWSHVYLLCRLRVRAPWHIERLQQLEISRERGRELSFLCDAGTILYKDDTSTSSQRSATRKSDREVGEKVARILDDCNLRHPELIRLALEAFLPARVSDEGCEPTAFEIISSHLDRLGASPNALRLASVTPEIPPFNFHAEGIEIWNGEGGEEYASRTREEFELELDAYLTEVQKALELPDAPGNRLRLSAGSEPVVLMPDWKGLHKWFFDAWVLSQSTDEDGHRLTNEQVWSKAGLWSIEKRDELVRKAVAQVGVWIGVEVRKGNPGRPYKAR